MTLRHPEKKIKRKSNRSIFKPRNSKLSTKSKIDLRKIQSYMSSTDDSECESVIFFIKNLCVNDAMISVWVLYY